MFLEKNLKIFTTLLGAVIVMEGLYKAFKFQSITALYISLVIIIVGPIEDLLNNNTNLPEYIIDQLTSIAFLIFLGLMLNDNHLIKPSVSQ
jgi:hypothetical protein